MFCGDRHSEGSCCEAQVVFDPDCRWHAHAGDHRCGVLRWDNAREISEAAVSRLNAEARSNVVAELFDSLARI